MAAGLGEEPARYHRNGDSNLSRLRFEVQKALRPSLLSGASTQIGDAELAWHWYGHADVELVRRYGLAPYSQPVLAETARDVDGFTYAALASSAEYGSSFTTAFITPDVAREACKAFAIAGLPEIDNIRPKLTNKVFAILIPETVWQHMLHEARFVPEWFLGIVLAFNCRYYKRFEPSMPDDLKDEMARSKMVSTVTQFMDGASFGRVERAAAERELQRFIEIIGRKRRAPPTPLPRRRLRKPA